MRLPATPKISQLRETGFPALKSAFSVVWRREAYARTPRIAGLTGRFLSKYGGWSNTHRRFIRWRDKGIWEGLLEILIDEPDYEWLMIDASHCKVHPHASGAKGGNQDMSRTKGGSIQKYIWRWMRMVCRSESLSLKVQRRIARRLQS